MEMKFTCSLLCVEVNLRIDGGGNELDSCYQKL